MSAALIAAVLYESLSCVYNAILLNGNGCTSNLRRIDQARFCGSYHRRILRIVVANT
jgi:hypothetical protein